VLTGEDAVEEVCVGLSEESAAETVGVGVLAPADVAKGLRVTLPDEGATAGVGVGVICALRGGI
jgi:hypothetical protein